MGYTDF
jgi:hypothetical protein